MSSFTNDVLIATPEVSLSGSGTLLHATPLLLLAIGVWLLEQHKRSNEVEGDSLAHEARLAWLGRLRPFAAEGVALMVCFGLVTLLLAPGEQSSASSQDKVWTEITKEWPILITADSLLGIQAMLRVILLVSMSYRKSAESSGPLELEPAAFMLLAAAVRVAIVVLSPADVYQLDGPLGGMMNLAFEVAAIPCLLFLSRHMLHAGRRVALLFIAGTLLSAWAANCNQLNLTDHDGDAYLDGLFIFGHLLETCAAIAVFARTVGYWTSLSVCADPAAILAHVLLPVQQFLAAYFMLTAFSQPFDFPPYLARVGYPLQLLQLAGVTQVGLYLMAAALHFTDYSEGPKPMELYVQV